MKRRDPIAKPTPRTNWINYMTQVLALIGLWQLVSNGITLFTRWF